MENVIDLSAFSANPINKAFMEKYLEPNLILIVKIIRYIIDFDLLHKRLSSSLSEYSLF